MATLADTPTPRHSVTAPSARLAFQKSNDSEFMRAEAVLAGLFSGLPTLNPLFGNALGAFLRATRKTGKRRHKAVETRRYTDTPTHRYLCMAPRKA